MGEPTDHDPLLREHKGRLLVYEAVIRRLIIALAEATDRDADAVRSEIKVGVERDIAYLKLSAVGQSLTSEMIGLDKARKAVFSTDLIAPPFN
jgi:hypothetical protein